MSTTPKPPLVINKFEDRNDLLSNDFKIIIHILSISIPAVIFVAILAYSSSSPNSSFSLATGMTSFLYFAVYTAFVYFIAGGFDWRPKKLQTVRIVLFWILGDLIGSAVFYGLWFLIRMVVASAYKIPMITAMGRLLAGKRKTYPDSPASEKDLACEKCDSKTSAGAYYSFLYGKKGYRSVEYGPASYSGQVKVTKTQIKDLTEARGYLCNKCVCLEGERSTARFFQKATFILLGMTLILLPIGAMIGHPEAFIFSGMFLVYGLPVVIIQFLMLKGKEEAPVHAYADLFENPKYKHMGKFAAKLQPNLVNQGEKVAIAVRRPLLAKSGVDAFYTHVEAKEKLTRA